MLLSNTSPPGRRARSVSSSFLAFLGEIFAQRTRALSNLMPPPFFSSSAVGTTPRRGKREAGVGMNSELAAACSLSSFMRGPPFFWGKVITFRVASVSFFFPLCPSGI